MILGKKLLLFAGVGILSFSSFFNNKLKILESESSIRFHLVSKDITGSIGGLVTTADFDPENLHTSWVKAEVSVESFTTGNKIRDIKFFSKRFLDKKNFKKITFKSTKIVGMDHGYIVIGDLTIKNVTKQIALDLIYSEGIVAGVASINLKDFDMQVSEKRNENKLDVYMDIRVVKENRLVEN